MRKSRSYVYDAQFGCNQLNMLVDLGIEILERIVKDGVKEMMIKIAGGSRGAKNQKHWFILQ